MLRVCLDTLIRDVLEDSCRRCSPLVHRAPGKSYFVDVTSGLMQQLRMPPSVQGLPREALRTICDTLMSAKQHSFDSNDESKHRYVGLQTILSLARTSRLLHEHAADALWDTIPAFGILVYTLPRDMWGCERGEENAHPGGPLSLNLKRPLLEADLVRFYHYASRVKRILLPSDCAQFPPHTRSLVFSPNILDAFESYPRGQVLPNLRILRSSPNLQYYQEFYRSFPVLFGPNLQDVFTWCPYVDPTVPQVDEGYYKWMLTRLHVIAPNLSTLILNANGHPLADTHAPILSSVASNTSRQLCALHVGHMALNIYALHHLAELPSLVILGAKLEDRITAASLAFLRAPGMTYFPRLEAVHLVHSHDLFLLSLFVQHTQPTLTRLKTIDLVLNTATPFQHIVDFLASIVKREGADSIETISLDCWVHRESPGPHVLTEDHLRPFFALGRLTCFNLNVRCDFDIDNGTLDSIAAAWPDLTMLELGPAHEATTSKVTLKGLIPLARGCPGLRRLGLTIDAAAPMEASIDLNGPYGSLLLHGPTTNVDLSMLPDPKLVTPQHFQEEPPDEPSPLEELRLGRSPIAEPAAVAGFLSCFFPNLKRVHGQWRPIELLDPDFSGIERDWSEEEVRGIIAEAESRMAWYWVVDHALPELTRIREDERNAYRPATVVESSSDSDV